MNFLDIVFATLPVFLICGIGFATRRLGVITDDSEKSIMQLIMTVLYPCFILSRVPGNTSLKDPLVVTSAIGAGFLLTVSGMLVAFAVARSLKLKKQQGRNTFCLATAIQNYGFIPIPLIEALFPEDVAIETVGVLFVHSLGLEIALWTIGVVILSGTIKGSAKRLINGPTVAIFIGLLLNFSGMSAHIPEFVKSAIQQLGNCSIPVSLVLCGATFCGVLQKHKWTFDWKVVGGACLVRFAIMPVVFLIVASVVKFSPELSRLLVIQSAMPAAVFPVVMAKHFGGKPAVAAQVSIVTTALSIVLTPLLLTFGMWLVGLNSGSG
jgi:predicted permease